MDECRGLEGSLAPLERERALFLYRSALENGDADTLDRVLQLAETDAMLESMILESHALDVAEEEAASSQSSGGWNVSEVRDTLALHLSDEILTGATSAPREEERQLDSRELERPPLTFAEVAAHMESDVRMASAQSPTTRELAPSELHQFTQQLRNVALPLPGQLDDRSLSYFFQKLGMTSSAQFRTEFRETALRLRQTP